jgi:hypothetical protein
MVRRGRSGRQGAPKLCHYPDHCGQFLRHGGTKVKARIAGCDDDVTKPYGPIQLLRINHGVWARSREGRLVCFVGPHSRRNVNAMNFSFWVMAGIASTPLACLLYPGSAAEVVALPRFPAQCQ